MSEQDWEQANQAYLASALGEVYAAVSRSVGIEEEPGPVPVLPEMENTAALDRLCETFGLSGFERRLLLMCAGAEMDSRFAHLYREASKRAPSPLPTFSLALATFADAHWSALLPGRPLRFWNLIEIVSGDVLTASPLKIDERILHYLAGTYLVDERIRSVTLAGNPPGELPPTHRARAEEVAAAWTREGTLPAVQLCGAEAAAKRGIAALACASTGLNLRSISAGAVPRVAADFELFLRLWEREVALHPACLLVEFDDAETPDGAGEAAVNRVLERLHSPIIISVRERRKPVERLVVSFDVQRPTAQEQRAIWMRALDSPPQTIKPSVMGHPEVDQLVEQFNLDAGSIEAAVAEAGEGSLWDACRRQARPRMEGLAQRLETVAGWDDLVLPAKQKQLLAQIAVQVRQRNTVYKDWGFEGKGASGLGISAMFAGPSGTGKTMAAEALANELQLDLCRIDLSQVISKYIGETEKNLRRVFDAAEDGASVLLFDEADALFGKRSEVKDSHDRYANIEVSYLLQRMEQYRGLAILTTNRKDALDTAFLRRIRFVVEFPFPEVAQRTEMWQRVFPRETPTDGLRVEKLARLHAAGGNIRNIAMGAAFLAADAGEPVRMTHLLSAAKAEFAKLERPLSDLETAGWACGELL